MRKLIVAEFISPDGVIQAPVGLKKIPAADSASVAGKCPTRRGHRPSRAGESVESEPLSRCKSLNRGVGCGYRKRLPAWLSGRALASHPM